MQGISFKDVVPKVLAAVILAGSAVNVSAGSISGVLNVTATVQAQCLISSVDDVVFGTYTQGVGSVPGNGSINLNCGVGTSYFVALSGPTASNRFMVNAASDQLQYQLFSDTLKTAVWGSTNGTDTVDGTGTGAIVNLPIYATLFDSLANRAKPAGAYTGVVTITVTY